MTDCCESCKEPLYPDDEKVFYRFAWYHIECAERLELPLDEDQDE